MRRLSTRIVLFQQHAANALGLIHTDIKTADILHETGPITAGELSRITGLTTGTVTALVDRLEAAGYVRRERDTADRRRVIIVPVDTRQSDIQAVYAPLAAAVQHMGAQYNEEELALLQDFVRRISGVYEDEMQRLTARE
ncbi:MarR family transcriptional regulator [Paenibacillus sp. IB182496]|uniref:MarR family transcriptional regulator n=1 Tax=Paenibacillus sabuli TaxID=2772509 RepID=A0A927BU70_9BACL|nr:MarR family transcriptional regulator [Paenibacillus sabuli]MBD2846896.1 MarR family transcriptional regulator [Paenibacillus sabuli]